MQRGVVSRPGSHRKLSFSAVADAIADEVEATRATARVTCDGWMARFECHTEPQVDVRGFMRMFSHILLLQEWVVAMLLVGRLLKKVKHTLSTFNAHRLILTAAIISLKLNRDVANVNGAFARAMRMEVKEVGQMETAFLRMIEWDIIVSAEEYAHTCMCLCG